MATNKKITFVGFKDSNHGQKIVRIDSPSTRKTYYEKGYIPESEFDALDTESEDEIQKKIDAMKARLEAKQKKISGKKTAAKKTAAPAIKSAGKKTAAKKTAAESEEGQDNDDDDQDGDDNDGNENQSGENGDEGLEFKE